MVGRGIEGGSRGSKKRVACRIELEYLGRRSSAERGGQLDVRVFVANQGVLLGFKSVGLGYRDIKSRIMYRCLSQN